ncbi:MAG: PilT/PilU family type 4a pilus ATPase [Patescibacteria group bacterium]
MATDYQKTAERLVEITLKEGASDLHITAEHSPTIRVSGTLIPLVREPVLSPEDARGISLALLSPDAQKQFLENKEMDFAYSTANGDRFRGNAFFQKGYVGSALRSIPKHLKTIEELNLPAILRDFCFKPQGFFMVVGPVGQGKSTTLAAMIECINRDRAQHIVTIEDPIEYLFTPDKSIIDQREVRFDTTSFHAALRSMFRQDVNVGLVGEMRDPETIATAVTAAETGHLIFSTLHTNNAAQTIDRIIDSFPAGQQDQIRIQLAGSLLGIFSQRLIPRVSGGLVPAYELLINTPAVSNLIREKRTTEINVMIETGSNEGMIDMNHSLAELVRRGEITLENAHHHSFNPKGLQRLV